jgi:outer membrane protein TolC
LFRLATLMGSVPRDFPAEVANCVQPPRVTTVLPVGDGAALLRRRPDVRQAERDLAASTARIGVAVADLYPKISFGLSAVSAGPIGDFGKRDTFAWNVGPLISWSVPNTGVVRARIAQAEAGSRINFAKFDGTVLTALRETETALDTYSHELERQASLQAARDASANVAEQARRLYQGGRTGYLDALDAERSLAASEATLAASKAQLADDQIALFLALGGGWEPGS